MTETLSFWTRVGLLSFILALSFQLSLHATPEPPNTDAEETISCDVDGGYLSDRWLRTERVICAGDGNEDPIEVLVRHAYGPSSAWVITDPNGNILGIPPGPPFDLEGAGQGTCLVWHVSFDGDLSGVEVGKNANDIEGCYDLSNPLTIYRNGVNGGTISTNDPTQICAGDGQADLIDVYVEGSEGPEAAWVITDQAGKILGLPAAPPFNFEGAGEGVCLIWYLRYEGPIDGLAMGKNANEFRGCYDLSNPITVYRDGVDGGYLTTAGGMTEKTICAGDGESDAFDVNLTGVAGANSAWVITDDALNILALPPSPPFDLEGAGAGTCLIWHLSYEDGLMGAAVGMNAANLDGCYDLSNPITVYRETGDDCEVTCNVSGGHLSTTGGMTEKMICAGDGESDAFDVIVTGQSSTNSAWVITDDMGNILALPPAPPFDLEGAGAGTCLIWYLAFDGAIGGAEVGKNAADLEGCYELSNPITVIRKTGSDCDAECNVNGGYLTDGHLRTGRVICAGDGDSDAFDVNLSGQMGENSAWVITDPNGNILGLPAAPPFDLEGAGAGTCLIWHLSFDGEISGAEVGKNAADLEGCYDLSNPYTVYRNGVNGGTISTNDPTHICAGDGQADPINVYVEGSEGPNAAWVITDQAGKILGLPAAPPFDLEGAGEGVCLIWYLRYEGPLEGLEMGKNANDFRGCYDLSNPITVYRDGVDGGYLTTAGGMTEKTICAGDGESDAFDVNLTGVSGANSAWVITDDALNILALPPAPPFDLEGAGAGTCLIWHLSFEDGLMGAAVGMNAANLEGCYDLSNPITVYRQTGDDCEEVCDVSGGHLTTAGGMTEKVICAGDGESDAFDVIVTGQSSPSSAWVITDDMGNILALPPAPPFDLEGAGAGTCLIWYLAFDGEISGAEVGSNAADLEGCYELSNPITVIRKTGSDCEMDCDVNGGYLTDAWLRTQRVICAGDGDSDAFNVRLSGQMGSNSAWVITDDAGNILALPPSPPFDLEGAGSGVCLIWHLSYDGEISGAEVGMNAADLEGCYDLSNPYTVYRNGVNGGTISTNDNTHICAGDGQADYIDVYVEGSEGPNAAWVITDQAGKILGLPAAPPFNFEGAGEGVCLIWYLRYEGPIDGLAMGKNANDFRGCYDLSNPITVYRDGVDGGQLTTAGGMTEKTICAGDGVSDAFDVNLTGATGANSAWVITDDALNILALPPAPPFDLEGAGAGTCLIWHLSFEDGLMGAAVGMNAADLEGCYDLSNPITVYRETGEDCSQCEVEVGDIYLAGGGTSTSICVDGNPDPLDIVTSGGTPNVSTGWIITDDLGNILALPAGPPFDLDGAGVGVCEIWYIRYETLTGRMVGNNLSDLEGCYALSNPVTVTREAPDGGMVSLLDGSTTYTGTAGNIVFDVKHTTAAPNLSYWYIITDDNDYILGFMNSANGNTLDLSVAPPGECHIWGWSYRGLSDPVMGEHISTLADDDCEDISDNFVRIIREDGDCAVDGGHIYTNDATTICAGDGEEDYVDVNLSGADGANSAWVITDDAGYILALPAAPPFNFEGAGEGVCLIWHLSFDGAISGAEVGQNAADLEGCYELSNSIKVIRRTSGQVCGRYNNNSHSLTVDLAPNPVSSDLRVDITIGEGGNFRTSTIEIMTSVGRRVYRRTEATYDGDNRVNINVSDLQPGVYFLRVRNGSQREVVRFVKQ
ncbi:MAG: T9SS type A sorting domain-containing protein [Saprospiraceae bacterium]|nr:T9SS type A sorting domain-containing protein [Saprospiraceae bacterium]